MYAIRSYYGVAPGYYLHPGHDLGGEGDLGESDLLSQAADSQFMIRPGIGVHEHDGKAADALIIDGLEVEFYGLYIQGTDHCQAVTGRITSYNVCYTKLLRYRWFQICGAPHTQREMPG